MRLSLAALGLAGLAGLTGLVGAQTTQYCDPAVGGLCFQSHTEPVHNISFRIVFPPGTGATEFIGVIEAPTAIKWAGWAIKGQMLNHPLLVGWPNAGAIVKNVLKIGVYYDQPTPWGTGPVLTTLPQTTIGSSTWKWVFRCQNCTTWSTGSFNPDDVPTMGWASGTVAPDTPASPNTTFIEHDNFNFWGCIAVNAHDANYNNFLNGGTATTTITTTTTTTSTTPTVTVKPTPYDYIVVGAGAGGIVVAERLAATGKKVILLERGGPSFSVTGGKDVPAWGNADDTRFDVPGLFEGMFGGTYERYWWCKDVAYWAGCLTGGGTSVNAALYWLPTNDDFSTNNGWPSGWQSISAPVSRLTARLPSTDVPSPDGKLYLQETYGVVEQILKPLGYTNITINNNVNFKDHVYGHTAYNFKNGKRAGPVVTYLQDSLKRTNFTFKQYVYVQSVVRNGGQITGVQTNDTTLGPNGFIPVTAKGRVILSAGAFGTARLLFTSGIGPSDMINVAKGNPTVGSLVPPSSQWINLPVGSYVQDNPSINLIYEHPTVDAYDNWDADILWSNPRTADKNLYKASNSGVFAGASPRINFWQAVGGSGDNKTRWLQGTVRPGGYGINTTQPYNSSRIFLTTMYLSYGVTSRGRIGIDAAMKGITITRPWFTDPYDKAAMVRGINSYITAAKSVSGLKLVTPDLTSTTLQAYVDNYVPDTMCSNHWLASARIGTSSSNSVVDVNTKVWNTTNLFIVDASIFPSLPMSNPHAAIMVSAEIAADKIIALAGGP